MISRTVGRQARISIDRVPLVALRSSSLTGQYRLGVHVEHSNCTARRRLFSTPIGEPGTASSNRIEDDVVHANGNGARKVKIGLHPAPKKVGLEPKGIPTPAHITSNNVGSSKNPETSQTSSHSQTPFSSTASLSSTTSPSSSQTSQTRQSDASTSKTASAIQMAIEDMRKAAQHGILKPPPEEFGKFKRAFHQAKELFKFYFRGLKLLWVHRKTVVEIRSRLAQEGQTEPMTRWEKQFIRTHERDMVKLVPFLLILLILEEILPLVVLYLPGLLPSTCILPSQLERIENKAEDIRKTAYASIKQWLAQSNMRDGIDDIRHADGPLVKEICRVLALSSRGPVAMARTRLERHLSYLAEDDALLQKEGSGKNLSERDLRVALAERGLLTKNLEDIDLRPQLVGWLSDGGGINTLIDRVRQSP